MEGTPASFISNIKKKKNKAIDVVFHLCVNIISMCKKTQLKVSDVVKVKFIHQGLLLKEKTRSFK